MRKKQKVALNKEAKLLKKTVEHVKRKRNKKKIDQGNGRYKNNGGATIAQMTTELKRKCAAEYVKDMDLIKAADRAGVRWGTLRNLIERDGEFNAMFTALGGQAAQESEMTAKEVLIEISRVGRANMMDYMERGEDGDIRFNISAATRAQMAAVQGFDVNGRPKLHNKMDALKLIGAHHKLFDAAGLPQSTPPPALHIHFTDEEKSA